MTAINPTNMKPFANLHGWSDIHPFEVIKVNTPNKLTIRPMNHSELLNKDELVFHAGGFSAHCSNQNVQRYTYSSNPEAGTLAIRYSKAKRRWQDADGNIYVLADKPKYFYDFNF